MEVVVAGNSNGTPDVLDIPSKSMAMQQWAAGFVQDVALLEMLFNPLPHWLNGKERRKQGIEPTSEAQVLQTRSSRHIGSNCEIVT